ncbi:multidrug ABC transporter substrate-binding protein [bacterium]|jgi:putative ABC transport system permease protein|nr:multidrug ABC transporter substrate-binding protein [bacterium]MDP6571611.1 ABC transporter permease [Patescibacteria group bacterium]|tara:strand:- start:4447 stop:5679 length:1233 start_codon:yes stop_codon:yes gene_type:complete
MNVLKLIKESFTILKTNRRRTILTSLGIIIGVSAVIVVMSVGAGAQSLIFNQITSAGSNLIGVLPGYSDDEGPPASVFGIVVTTLKHGDAQAIAKIPEITAVTSYARGIDTITWSNKKTDATYVGTTADYVRVEDTQVEIGSFFSKDDNKSMNRVIVLGWQVAQDLFDDEDPIGQRVKIKRESFRVIGVMEKRGTESFQNQDTLVFIPLSAAQKLLLGINHVSLIRAKVASEDEIGFAIAQVEDVLRERHGLSGSQENDFSVRATAQVLDALGSITDALTYFLSAIAAISLIVGGIGIMNIMLIAVRERTREIGLRKAVGATPASIQSQFLVEAIAVTLVGGVLGIVFGALFSGAIAIGAQYAGYNWDYVVSIGSVLMGIIVSSAVGIIFGWYPARRASKLDPVEALHYE